MTAIKDKPIIAGNKKIAVFTGTRAEYGLLYWLLRNILASDAQLQLIVGGMHLSPEFGYTVEQIEQDGFEIADRLEFLLSSESPVGITKSLGLATISAAESLARLKPDMLVLLGDRFEALAIAQAAMIAQIPIAHIHGGELTEGVIDDAIRHSITKMSHLHFTSTESYRRRVIQLGEQPSNVHHYGAPGLDNLQKLELLDRASLMSSLQLDWKGDFALMTYHPITLSEEGGKTALLALLKVLESTPHNVIITYPNADTFGRQLISVLRDFQAKYPQRVYLTQSMGRIRYLSAMQLASVVIGNSSSGIIEAPSCGVPTVNIGSRQLGRIAAESVLHCGESEAEISQCLQHALSDEHQRLSANVENPYGQGDASEKILATLLSFDCTQIRPKAFYDLPHSSD
ncbi:UDP-N-acetylglucosamine 2-epimerase [Thalassotalea fusca]